MQGTAATTKMVAFALAGLLGRPVIDETGVTGVYDLSMEWAPDPAAGEVASANSDLPSLFTAIQDQLVFVIEKIEKPSEN